MGEGLMADEAKDAVFLLIGAGTWVENWPTSPPTL